MFKMLDTCTMQPYIKGHVYWSIVVYFFFFGTLKPTGCLISPAHMWEEAGDPLSRPPAMPIAQSSPLTLSPALRVETCIKLCKCKSYIILWCLFLCFILSRFVTYFDLFHCSTHDFHDLIMAIIICLCLYQGCLWVWPHPADRHVHPKAHAVVLFPGPQHESWRVLPLHYHQPDEERQLVFSRHETPPLFREVGAGEGRRMATQWIKHQILSKL